MEKLVIPSTKETPEVTLDPETGYCEISGRSLPENAFAFYTPIKDWFTQVRDSATINNFHIVFKYDYFNTSTTKQLVNIFVALNEISSDIQIKIDWYYYELDVEIEKAGLRFRDLFDLNISLIEEPV